MRGGGGGAEAAGWGELPLAGTDGRGIPLLEGWGLSVCLLEVVES